MDVSQEMDDSPNEPGDHVMPEARAELDGPPRCPLPHQQAGLPATPTPTPMAMIQEAVRSNADPATVERLMDLALRWEAEQARKAFFAALSQFRGRVKAVTKGRRADFRAKKESAGRVSYAYATLDAICAEIDPICNDLGLSYYWENKQDRALICVTCTVCHTSGHTITSQMQASPDTSGTKNPLQSIGSALTYLKRYTLGLSLGIPISDDTDAAEIPQQPADNRPDNHPVITPPPAAQPARQEYSFADVELNKHHWIRSIRAGRHTPASLLTMIKTRYAVPAAVEKVIMELK